MARGEVVFSISDYAQEFIREYKNPKLDQKVIDAIVVDFINYFAGMHCRMDLAMIITKLLVTIYTRTAFLMIMIMK